MNLGTWVIRALELLFAVGIIGSAIVVLLTSIEDTKEIVTREREPESERVNDPSGPELPD